MLDLAGLKVREIEVLGTGGRLSSSMRYARTAVILYALALVVAAGGESAHQQLPRDVGTGEIAALLVNGTEAGLRTHDKPAVLVIGSGRELVHPSLLPLVSQDRAQGPAKEITQSVEIGQFDPFVICDLDVLGRADEVEGHPRLPDRLPEANSDKR